MRPTIDKTKNSKFLQIFWKSRPKVQMNLFRCGVVEISNTADDALNILKSDRHNIMQHRIASNFNK